MSDDEKKSQGSCTSNIDSFRVRLAPFWPNSPTAWFAQVEAQFALYSIKADSSKFYHVVAVLPPEVCESVIELLNEPPETEKYGTLKSALLKRHTLSEEKRLEKLLERADLGDTKPSEAYRQMKRLATEKVDSTIIKNLWLRRLPNLVNISLIAVGDKPIDDLLDLADKLYEATQPPSVSNIACAGPSSPKPSTSSTATTTQKSKTTKDLELEIAELKLMIANLSFDRSRSSRRYGRGNQSYRQRSRSSSRDRQSDVCYYHRNFGSKATKCTIPCGNKSAKDSKPQGNSSSPPN